MKNQAKRLCIIIVAAQVACVTTGLWIHSRLVFSTLNTATEKQAWNDLKLTADKLVPAFRELDLTNLLTETADAERIRALIRSSRQSPREMVTIVDAGRQILFDEPLPDEDGAASQDLGQVVSWTKLSTMSASRAHPLSAKLNFPDGAHNGLAYELKDGRGHILIHRRAANMTAGPTVSPGSLLATGGIAFFWIAALLAPTTYILLARLQDGFSREYARLQDKGTKRAQDLVRTRDAVIFGLAKLADSRDPETGGHLERITLYASLLTSVLRRCPNYRNVVTPTFVRLMEINTALHDIGKVGIEDAILLKPGPLTDDERIRMQQHTNIGAECLKKIEECLGSSNFLQMGHTIALYHHERWDGAGYPTGLAGEQIPLPARIVAIADVYEALSSKRVYKKAFPHQKCVAIIREEAGTQFDPELVKVFLRVESQFHKVARQFREETDRPPDQGPSETVETMDQEVGEPSLAGVSTVDG